MSVNPEENIDLNDTPIGKELLYLHTHRLTAEEEKRRKELLREVYFDKADEAQEIIRTLGVVPSAVKMPATFSRIVNLCTEGLDTVMSEGSVELKRLEEHVLRNMNPVTILLTSNIETGRLQPKGQVFSEQGASGISPSVPSEPEAYPPIPVAFREQRKPLTRCELDVLEDQAKYHEEQYHKMRALVAEHLLCCSKPMKLHNAPQITLERAVAVLNDHKHEFDHCELFHDSNVPVDAEWVIDVKGRWPGVNVLLQTKSGNARTAKRYSEFTAIAVAEKYIREAK